jgi:pseudouridine synthase
VSEDGAEGIRLQRHLARCGHGSRRSAEALITSGRVSVNGRRVTELGTRVRPERDRVEVDGRVVRRSADTWVALHKQRGAVTTRRDPRGRRTIYDALPEEYGELFHVGRLDRQSEGLLLLTNDGETAHRLMHPRFNVRREYVVQPEQRLTDAELARLRAGIKLEDGRVRLLSLERFGGPGTNDPRIRLELAEGRNREIRRLMEAIGHRAVRLRRVRYGPIRLGKLAPGRWRELTAEEVEALKRHKAGKGRRTA